MKDSKEYKDIKDIIKQINDNKKILPYIMNISSLNDSIQLNPLLSPSMIKILLNRNFFYNKLYTEEKIDKAFTYIYLGLCRIFELRIKRDSESFCPDIESKTLTNESYNLGNYVSIEVSQNEFFENKYENFALYRYDLLIRYNRSFKLDELFSYDNFSKYISDNI